MPELLSSELWFGPLNSTVTAVRANDPVVEVSSCPNFGGVTKSADVNAESFDFCTPLLKRLPLTYR
jgi:hypothetical protein